MLGPSRSSPPPDTSSPSTTSQLLLGLYHGSLAVETSSPSNDILRPSHSSPVLQGSGSSSPPGPKRLPNHSSFQRQAQNSYSRPRRCQERSRAPTPSARSSTPSQVVLGLSHSLLAHKTGSPSTTSQLPLGPPVGPQHSRAAPAPAPLGPCGCGTAPACNTESQLPTAGPHTVTGPAVRHPPLLTLIPLHRHNKAGC